MAQENKTYPASGHSVSYGYGRKNGKGEWSDVILPAMQTQRDGGVQSMSYVIRGLEASQNYEAKVLARNKFGWGPISDSFTFHTTDTGQLESGFCLILFSFTGKIILIKFLFRFGFKSGLNFK